MNSPLSIRFTAALTLLAALVAACHYTKTTETWDLTTNTKKTVTETITETITVDPQVLLDIPFGLVRVGKSFVPGLDKVVEEYDEDGDGKPDFVVCGGNLYRVTKIKRVNKLKTGRWAAAEVLIREPGKHPTPKVTMPLPAEVYIRRFGYEKTLVAGARDLTHAAIDVHEALLNTADVLQSYVHLSRRRLMLWKTLSVVPFTGVRERITVSFPTGFPGTGKTGGGSAVAPALDDSAATVCYTQELEGTFFDLARYLVRDGVKLFEMTVFGQKIKFVSPDKKNVTFFYNGRNLGTFQV